MKYTTTSLVALSMTLLCNVSDAHQDTRLKFDNGKIIGLPDAYLPSSFDAVELSVTIAGRKLMLPEVFQRLLKKNVNVDPFDGSRQIENVPCTFTFSASWYHAELGGDLPPYMLISILPKGNDCHFEILVDMDHLKILKADIQIKNLGSVPIDLADGIRVGNKKNGKQALDGNAH